jgi:hypothetical protein
MNVSVDVATYVKKSIVAFVRNAGNWLSGYGQQWFFLSGRSIPVPAVNYSQFVNDSPENVSWVFNTDSKCLSPPTYWSDRSKLRCLSIQLHEGPAVHSLDDLISDMNLFMTNELPLPTVLAGCWSIQSGIWPAPEKSPTLHIIDRMGEEHTIPVFGDYSDEEWASSLGISVPEVTEETVDEEVEEAEEDEAEEDEAEEDDEYEEEEDEEQDDKQVGMAEEEEIEKEAEDDLEGFIPLINRPL